MRRINQVDVSGGFSRNHNRGTRDKMTAAAKLANAVGQYVSVVENESNLVMNHDAKLQLWPFFIADSLHEWKEARKQSY